MRAWLAEAGTCSNTVSRFWNAKMQFLRVLFLEAIRGMSCLNLLSVSRRFIATADRNDQGYQRKMSLLQQISIPKYYPRSYEEDEKPVGISFHNGAEFLTIK
jgi:hypothetical protein